MTLQLQQPKLKQAEVAQLLKNPPPQSTMALPLPIFDN
ncbi:hypothetical protein A2U01_0090513, partial [Trifolium medium]|nr:hypothetical protein [Trifolium medium]